METIQQKTLFDFQDQNLKQKIKRLLILNPSFRDSDEELAAHIWREEVKLIYGDLNVNVGTFLNDLSFNRFSSYESMRRYRQLIQHNDPSLKGKKKTRRSKADTEVRRRVIKKEL